MANCAQRLLNTPCKCLLPIFLVQKAGISRHRIGLCRAKTVQEVINDFPPFIFRYVRQLRLFRQA